MQNLEDMFKKIDEYTSYLKDRGQAFAEEGWPIFHEGQFLTEWPAKVVPYYQRHDKGLGNPRKIALCLYADDDEIYPRLDKVLTDIAVYRAYAGCVGCDLSVANDVDEERQDALLLLNRLHMAILADNDVKLIANTRTGGRKTLRSLQYLPKHIMCASGFLGCDYEPEYDLDYVAKIMALRPSKLIVYGKCNNTQREKLDRMGINYRVYADYHTWCKRRTKNHG